MLSVLFSAAITSCAAPAYCPTNDQLKLALRQQSDAELWATMQAENEAHPERITLLTGQKLLAVRDVYCGLPDETKTIRCKYTAEYPSGWSFGVVSLSRAAEGWRALRTLAVWKDKPGNRRKR